MFGFADYKSPPLPKKVQKLVGSEATANFEKQVAEIHEKHPDATVFSWTVEYMETWWFLYNFYETFGMYPVPLVVDRESTPKVIQNSGREARTIASNNGKWRWFECDDGIYRDTIPVYQELRVYHNNFMWSMKDSYGKNLNVAPLVLKMEMDHLLFHEFHHFLHHAESYSKTFDAFQNKSFEDWAKLANDFQTQIKNTLADTRTDAFAMKDEKITESEAIQCSREHFLPTALGTYLGNGVLPLIGGSYDRFMRTKDSTYSLISHVIEKLMLEWKLFFADLSDEERKDVSHDRYKCIAHIKDLGNDIPKEKRKVIIVD